MKNMYSERILKTPKSFIREMMKAADDDSIISFAGGLPNPVSFPQEQLKESFERIVTKHGERLYQYSTTEGLYSLREYIAKQYQENYHLKVSADDILITTGSQQALDLIGKVFINEGDKIIMEKPGYLGAIQAFSFYEPEFIPVDLEEDGIDTNQLEKILCEQQVKLAYTVPNFQNPTGISYSMKKRMEVRDILKNHSTVLIQDNPYGDLIFEGESLPYIECKPEQMILLGTISKIITPGMRIGWICTPNKEIMDHLVVAKQASDLHSNIFSQFLIQDYLSHNDIQEHIDQIRILYKKQCQAMLAAIDRYFPKNIKITRPAGGMFIWAELPDEKNAMELFERAMKKGVSFVPGLQFYTDNSVNYTFRLNYTNADEATIEEGIKRLASVM